MSPDGARLVIMAKVPSTDSLVLDVGSIGDRKVVRWATIPGKGTKDIQANWLGDGSIMGTVYEDEFATMYRVSGPGRIQLLGNIPRATEVTWSRDGRMVAVITSEVHGDVWLARGSARGPAGTR